MAYSSKEKQRQGNRESYLRHREARLEKNRQWREANRERMKELNRRWYADHKDYAKDKKREYREANPERMRALVRKWYLENKHKTIATTRLKTTGCSTELYQRLLTEQDGLCAICNQLPGKYALAADHCHRTGRIRGLLCFKCNSLLGLAGENLAVLQAAIRYLESAAVAPDP